MSPGPSLTPPPSQPARWPWLAALAYTLFPIYGSLVPFSWTGLAPEVAWERFALLLAGPLVLESRADFAVNILLALPLALLWQAAWVNGLRLRAPAAIAAAAAAVWLACGVLALLLEFSQLWFSGRQPALSDVVAQSIGALLGLAAWRLVPAHFWAHSESPQQRWRRAWALYLAGLVLYALMPLDLTVSLSEIVAKWKLGQIRLLPFAAWGSQPVAGLTDFALEAAIWAAAAWLLGRAYGATAGWRGLVLVGLAVGLETAQILVLSRIVDTTDLLAAACGVLLARRLSGGRTPDTGPAATAAAAGANRLLLPMLLALGLLLASAWPFEFATHRAELRERLLGFSWTPFASYVAASELHLITSLLRRFAVYGGFAAACAWALQPFALGRSLRVLLLAVTAGALAGAVEMLDLLQPGHVADLGDPLLAAALGALVAGLWPDRASASPARATPPGVPFTPLQRSSATVLAAAVLLGAAVLPYLPGVPYNLRELLAPEGWPWPALAVSAAALLLAGGAAHLAGLATPGGASPGLHTLAALCGLPCALALVLVLGAPRESVYDLVGSPVLGLADSLETWGRMAVLLLGALWALACGQALGGASSNRTGSLTLLALHGLWVLPLWHGVVVSWAATDNLVELMAGGGGPVATACLLGYAALMGASAAGLWRALQGRRLGRAALVLVVAGALGWVLLNLGLQSLVLKYGKAFSALQFLLSSDRGHYAGTAQLVGRFLVAQGGLLLLCTLAAAMAQAWARPRSPAGPRTHRAHRRRRARPAA